MMKRYIVAVVLLINASTSSAHPWSVNEYLDNCSVVYQKTISADDYETVGYCMGLLKGAMAGLMIAQWAKSRELSLDKLRCVVIDGERSFFEIQKDVISYMRLNLVKEMNPDIPNTATGAVALSLLALYPCLYESVEAE